MGVIQVVVNLSEGLLSMYHPPGAAFDLHTRQCTWAGTLASVPGTL